MSNIIKKYTDFLKFRLNESEETKVSINDKLWEYKFDDFIDYINDFKDAEWKVDFETMIYLNEYVNLGYWGKENYQHKDFLTNVLSSGKQTPAYVLTISNDDDGKDVDLTDSLKFLKNIVEDELGLECIIMGDNSDQWFDVIDLDNIRIEDGSIYNGDDEIELLNVAFLGKDVNVTVMDLCDYYEWDFEIGTGDSPEARTIKIVDDLVYVRTDQDDLTYVAQDDNNGSSLEYLLNPPDDYYNWEGHIDTDSLITYHLNNKALSLLIKKIIADTGGLESFLNEYSDESDLDFEEIRNQDDIKDEEFEEKVIELILNERFKSTLKLICKNNDTFDDIRRDYDSWEAQARVDKFEDNLQSDFDDILSESFTFEKDKYKSEWKGGNGKWYHMYRYWVLIESKFIDELFLREEWEWEDFRGCGLTALPREWFDKCGGGETTLYANDPMDGDVDTDNFSDEMISNYLV
jgi:hypothetical protein